MARDNVDLIQESWEAFGRGDVDAAANSASDEAEIVVPETLPWGGTYIGPEGLRDLLDALRASFDGLKTVPEKVLGADDEHVVVVVRASGRTKQGHAVENRAAWVYRLRNSQIVHAEQFIDTAKTLRALA